MKANEVYRWLRHDVDPWAKAEGFKRGKTMLSWHRPHGDQHIVFWFQVSRDGWDDYAGSKVTMEFQVSAEPVVGDVSSFRQRLGQMLDDASREEARAIQNRVIASLPSPPRDHYALLDDRTRDWYLEKFKLVTERYTAKDDLWLRYHAEKHLHLWSEFVLRQLPGCIQQMGGSTSPPKPSGPDGRRWWKFW